MPFVIGDFVKKKRNLGQAGTLLRGPIDNCGDSYWNVRLAMGTRDEFTLAPRTSITRQAVVPPAQVPPTPLATSVYYALRGPQFSA
jgi:hypothetical protein